MLKWVQSNHKSFESVGLRDYYSPNDQMIRRMSRAWKTAFPKGILCKDNENMKEDITAHSFTPLVFPSAWDVTLRKCDIPTEKDILSAERAQGYEKLEITTEMQNMIRDAIDIIDPLITTNLLKCNTFVYKDVDETKEILGCSFRANSEIYLGLSERLFTKGIYQLSMTLLDEAVHVESGVHDHNRAYTEHLLGRVVSNLMKAKK